jgi:protein-S-isoprenylcysteine O-methyltransferase Ste14
MSRFKAASKRNVENQSDPVAVLSLISGLGFVISSIFEYKAHRDNPTQVPLQVAVLSLIAGLAFVIFGMSRGQTPRG